MMVVVVLMEKGGGGGGGGWGVLWEKCCVVDMRDAPTAK